MTSNALNEEVRAFFQSYTAAFEALLTHKLKSVPGVIRTQTVITLTSHKDTPALPLKS